MKKQQNLEMINFETETKMRTMIHDLILPFSQKFILAKLCLKIE